MAEIFAPTLSVVLFWCFIAYVSAYRESYDDKESMIELVMELKEKIYDQDKRISAQNERISALEDKQQELEKVNDVQSMKIEVFQEKIGAQDRMISHLKQMQIVCLRNIRIFERNLGYFNTALTRPHSIQFESSLHSFRKSNESIPSKLFRKERLLIPQTSLTNSAGSTVAFYAYSTRKVTAPSSHFVLTFDTVIINVGNGYHHHSGIFIAPQTGIYVLTWSFRIQNDAHLSTELIVNDKAISAVYFDATNYVGGNTAGTAVVHLNQNDDVFVRTSSASNLGDILSDPNGRSYFGGWMIA